jgi:uncharacterized membrane protein
MDTIRIPEKSRTIKLFPYFLLLIACLGLSVTILLNRIDLTVASLAVVVPIVLAAIILIANKQYTYAAPVVPTINKLDFSHLFLINILIFIISVIILVVYPTRPLAYFIFIAVFSGVLFLQILSRRPGWTDNLILIEIVFLSLNILWGVTLKYPLFFLDTDSMGHLNIINNILNTSHVESHLITYQYYPLYHIYTAVGIEITGMSIKTGLFVIIGIAWQAGIVFAFLIFRDLSKSGKFALLACLLFASSSQIIFYGNYAIARSLAFVFLMCWLYLIFRKAAKDPVYFLLSLIAMAAMIMTHHVNVLLVIPVLVTLYLCQVFIKKFQQVHIIEPLFIILVIISALSYMMWIATDMAVAVLPGMIRSLIMTDNTLVGDFTRGYGFSIMLGALYYSFALLVCLLGMRLVFNSKNSARYNGKANAFAFTGFPLLLVYIPGFVDLLPSSDVIFAHRLQLIVTPIIAFLMAYGIIYIFSLKSKRRGSPQAPAASVLAVIMVMIMTFTSMISTGNAQDYDHFPHTSAIDTPYFGNTELNSFQFLNNKANHETPLYTDYQTMRNEFMLNGFSTRNILTGGDVSYIRNGYINLRTAELRRKTALSFSPDGKGRVIYRYQIDPAQPEQNILNNLEEANRIYSNRAVQIFFVN